MRLMTNNSDVIKVSGYPNLSAKKTFLRFFPLTKIDLYVMKIYLQANGNIWSPLLKDKPVNEV